MKAALPNTRTSSGRIKPASGCAANRDILARLSTRDGPDERGPFLDKYVRARAQPARLRAPRQIPARWWHVCTPDGESRDPEAAPRMLVSSSARKRVLPGPAWHEAKP